MLILLSMLLVLITSTAIGAVSAMLEINKKSQFIATANGHSYKCYTFEDDEDHNPVNGVAIALNEDASTTSNTTIDVPGSVTHPESGVTYTVRALAPGAFRYTKFKQFNLPTSIEQIGEEAFAYCTNLLDFDIPYQVSEIAPSTFLDCRKLSYVYYNDDEGHRVFGNNTITKIGDHAFDTCLALKDFYCPSMVTYFGESCFHRCQSLVNFYFPSTIKEGNTITNEVTIRSYAFANCESLIFVYFEENVKEIDDYAFVDCNSTLAMKYNGYSVPNFYNGDDEQAHWRDTNIATNIDTLIPLQIKHPTIHSDPVYPCLRYTIENTPVKLDSAKGRDTIDIIDQDEIDAEGEYAVIYKFDLPTQTIEGCFNVSTGALTIPDTLDGKTVKVIRESTFANNSTILSVKFNANLVQICNNAFYYCPNIATLDFTECQKLREVSYFAFQNGSITNTQLTSLILPNSLEYVGDFAFSNFVNVTNFHLSTSMKAIADSAFFSLGKNKSGSVDLVLPKTLNDAAAEEANFFHQKSAGGYSHPYSGRWYAVGKYAFNQANCLRSVTMEEDTDPEHIGPTKDYACSFFSNSFKDAKNIISFKTSENAKYIGKDSFRGCAALRELFLTTAKAEAATEDADNPWCIDEDTGNFGGTFFTGTAVELVVYVKGEHAPGTLDTITSNADAVNPGKGDLNVPLGTRWNAETQDAYSNELKSFAGSVGSSYLSRTTVPTYYVNDFETDIFYWNPKTKVQAAKPTTVNNYNNGLVSFVKGSDDKYTVARYYYNGSTATDIIDLTQVPGISDATHSDLTIIGPEAFAKSAVLGADDSNDNKSNNKQPGAYFILPETITTVFERAFFRRTSDKGAAENNGRYGVRIVTYKDSDTGKYLDSDGTTKLTYAELTAKFTAMNNLWSKADVVTRRGYCVLPNAVTYIGKDAFYNHIFEKVVLGSNLTYIGNSAFYIHTITGSSGNQYGRNTLTDISIGTNSYFDISTNKGMYYIGDGDSKKMLMYQASNITGSLVLESNTKAIGFEGCANTKYSSIELPTGMTTIYGGGLFGNTELLSITGVSDLRYIGAMENANNKPSNPAWSDAGYTEVFDSDVAKHLSISDYRDYLYTARQYIEASYGAVAYCKKLTTIDFTLMTNLRKIGRSAFDNDVALINMAGSNKYTFKQYNASSNTSSIISGWDQVSSKILDLSYCTSLRSIDRMAFRNCNNIEYAIIPNTRGGASQSQIYIGIDPETNYLDSQDAKQIFKDSCGVKVLCEESALFASYDYGKNNGSRNHYLQNCFGKNNQVYYYVGANTDIPGSDATSLKYWTRDTDGSIILINSAKDARVMFPA